MGLFTKQSTILGIRRNVFFLSLVSLFNDASSEMIYPLIPLFLSSVLGASFTTIGIIEGVAESVASTFRVFSGWYSDRQKKRKMFAVIGYSFSTLVKPVLALATHPWHVLIVRFLDRTGKATRAAPRDALIADSVTAEERGKSFGFHKMFDTMGAAIGPLIGFFLLRAYQGNFRPVFFFSFIAGLIAVLTLILFTTDRPKDAALDARAEENALQPKKIKELFRGPFPLFLIASTVFALGNSSDAFMLLRAQDVGVATALIPIIYFLFNAVFSLLSFPIGILSDRIDRKLIIMTGYALFGIVYFMLARAELAWHAWAAFALFGISYACIEGVQKALIADFVPERLRATAYGAFNTLTGLALLPSSIIAGYLWERFDGAAPFLYGCGTALLALMLFLPLLFRARVRSSLPLTS